MKLKLGVVMDPLERIQYKKDTTFAMMLEAQRRHWEVHTIEMDGLCLRNGKAYAWSRSVELYDDSKRWHHYDQEEENPIDYFDVVLMRKDPPFDMEYIYATHLLEIAESAGVFVVNKPQSLRDVNEKLYTAWFSQCTPPTLVSRQHREFRKFLAEYHKIVLKPLDGMGGASIFVVSEDSPNISVILEMMTAYGSRQVMAQQYLPEISQGDKRILVVNGIAVPYALARIPAKGESRGNLAAGGTAIGVELTERDHWIVQQVAPTLIAKGLLFVGLDVIGDYLTEINVTSPTCARELDALYGLNIAGDFLDSIENCLDKR
ncbi:MAG TPA: glutathione synthase [Crenotrichaceae bacterium]|nr:glutathione synthase [Crenotrichaceae bacterium]